MKPIKKKYILLWYNHLDNESGGGGYFEFFELLQDVESKVNEVMKIKQCSIIYAGKLGKEIKF